MWQIGNCLKTKCCGVFDLNREETQKFNLMHRLANRWRTLKFFFNIYNLASTLYRGHLWAKNNTKSDTNSRRLPSSGEILNYFLTYLNSHDFLVKPHGPSYVFVWILFDRKLCFLSIWKHLHKFLSLKIYREKKKKFSSMDKLATRCRAVSKTLYSYAPWKLLFCLYIT